LFMASKIIISTVIDDLKVESPNCSFRDWICLGEMNDLTDGMRFRYLGPSGLRVSELSLGTMTFGEDWGWGASKEESRAIFECYVERGGNFIDTANGYTNGTSEKIVGELIKPDRDRFVLATKYSFPTVRGDPNGGGNHRKSMITMPSPHSSRDSFPRFWTPGNIFKSDDRHSPT
jgi:Aldo/keto reductase family